MFPATLLNERDMSSSSFFIEGLETMLIPKIRTDLASDLLVVPDSFSQ
jgi:hypothetical protein